VKIAAITITYNDGYKFKEWCEHYEDYKEELDVHIIVDNNSEPCYLSQVKAYFTNSIIIERKTNGGCTGAYNSGIKEALKDKDIDAIMLIGNDVKLLPGGIGILYRFLLSDIRFGSVQPILLKKDSYVIENYGCDINKSLYMKFNDYGKSLYDIEDDFRIVESVPGGINMSKRSFYEKVGLQDEKLFMYSDEVDMALRAKKYDFIMGATKKAISWHQHLNPDGGNFRLPFAAYLLGRNKVYLARKHFGFGRILFICAVQMKLFIGDILKSRGKKKEVLYQMAFLKGIINGLFYGVI